MSKPGASQQMAPQQAALAQPQYAVVAPSGGYKVEKREVVATTPELRMVILTLAPGEEVPWHFHHNVSDTFFCMEGPLVIHQGAPGSAAAGGAPPAAGAQDSVELVAGQMHAVTPGQPHRVTGKDMGRCRFAILQGVGKYDFVPLK